VKGRHPIHATGWRRVIGSHIFIGHFPQKSPIISGSFTNMTSQAANHFSPFYPQRIDSRRRSGLQQCVAVCCSVLQCVAHHELPNTSAFLSTANPLTEVIRLFLMGTVILLCLPRAVGVPLESALHLVSRMSHSRRRSGFGVATVSRID